ncbi:MAG: T9SS type A sorting domain-containing protein [Saprospiraceae bacterium]
MRNLFTIVLMFLALYAISQTNPSTISQKVVKGETFTYSLITTDGAIVSISSIYEDASNNPERNSFDIYFLANELGNYTDVFKYLENGNTYYTTFHIDVVASIISTRQDYDEILSGESLFLDVVSNDVGTASELMLSAIPYVQNGTARIVNGLVEFTPESGFEGLAYLNYVVTDSNGVSETGFATINVVSNPSGGQIATTLKPKYFVQIGEKLDMVVPIAMILSDISRPSLGKLNLLDQGVFRFDAGKKVGSETLSYNRNGASGQFEIHVFDKKENHGFVFDDKVYTTSGTPIDFDVFTNDLEAIYPISGKSPELKNVSPNSGRLVYNPPSGFQGVKNFYYEVNDGFTTHRGNITIVVSDDLPEIREYEFVTRENTAFVFDYDSPIENAVINFAQAPLNGLLRLTESGFFYCGGKVNGTDFIVYDPNPGFVGSDAFKLEYCSDNGNCVTLEVSIEVQSSSDDCNCIGADCTWPGDADGDGRVSVKDLLPIGYNIGKNGTARSENGNNWNALFADDWGESYGSLGNDIKSADSNGDGSIDEADVDALNENYSKLNSFLSSEALSIKSVPFYAVPSQTSGRDGDLITVDLYIGTEAQPLLESNGLAFSFSIPPIYIQENSLQFLFNHSDWFGYNNPTLDMVQYPDIGRVEGSISRTGGSSIDGFGHIGTFQIVLQEDFDDVKPESRKLPIEIDISGGEYINGAGNKYGLQDSKTVIYLDLNDQNIEKEIEIVTFPNPTADQLTIHSNNKDIIQNIYLYNTIGQRINSYHNIQSNHFEMNTSTLPEGFYMARVETLFGVSVEKVQVVRE